MSEREGEKRIHHPSLGPLIFLLFRNPFFPRTWTLFVFYSSKAQELFVFTANHFTLHPRGFFSPSLPHCTIIFCLLWLDPNILTDAFFYFSPSLSLSLLLILLLRHIGLDWINRTITGFMDPIERFYPFNGWIIYLHAGWSIRDPTRNSHPFRQWLGPTDQTRHHGRWRNLRMSG